MSKKFEGVIIRKANINDADEIIKIIHNRVDWLKQNKINQWKNFANRDRSYFIEKIEKEIVYVVDLKYNICGTFILQFKDNYWDDDKNAIYIHHFATKLGNDGLGKYIINEIKKIAIQNNKKYIRVDHEKYNEKLGRYYQKQGFIKVNEYKDGEYNCILREMQL